MTTTQWDEILAKKVARLYELVNVLDLVSFDTHNLLADFRFRALRSYPFESWGLKRIVRDLLAVPGRIYFDGPQVKRIELKSSHVHAYDLLTCLNRYQKQSFGE